MAAAVVETSPGTLTGAIDGVNRAFGTRSAMRLDLPVAVEVNGWSRLPQLDDGYELTSARVITLREAPDPRDTVAVRYYCDPPLAAFPGSTPVALTAVVVQPPALSAQTQPELTVMVPPA